MSCSSLNYFFNHYTVHWTFRYYNSLYSWRPVDLLKTSHHLVPETSPNLVPQMSRGRPHLELFNFCFSPVKINNRCVKQELLHQKTLFSLNHRFLCWSSKSPQKVPWRSRILRALRDFQRTSLERRGPAAKTQGL